MGRLRSAALVLLGCLGAGGCVRPPQDAEARLATLEAEARELDVELDGVEDRLLGSQMRLHLWSELATRHRSVSALACSNAEMHMESLLRHFEKTEQVLNKKKKGRGRRMASPTQPPGEAVEAGLGGPEAQD
ncbi:MAG: hypothetical protein L0Y66_04080 [Myxococcaceae bacterium]|nr:hypothetical protein [Myxococcaceae bacterium]MCI0671301.1 hypothetical protein [Myxococcaceae bacterium]